MTAVVLAATLWPVAPSLTPMARWCLVCGERGVADAFANVLLFFPLGLTLAGLRWPWYRALLAAVLLSAAIEGMQLRVVAGRDASPGDVFFDGLGAALGLLAAHLSAHRAVAWSRLLRAGAVAVPLAVAGATASLFQGSWPDTGWWGQWTADLGYLEAYQGRVLSASIAGTDVPSWRMPDTRVVREALQRGDPVRVRAMAGPATSALAPIFSILDDDQREILLIGPDRSDLVIRQRLRASAARLDQPDLRFRGAFENVRAGDTLLLRFWRAAPRGRWCAVLNASTHCELGWTVGRGWSLLSQHNAWPARLLGTLDVVWIGALFLPLGLAARGGTRRWPMLLVLPLSLALIPAGRLLPTPAILWIAALAGCSLGLLLPRRVAPVLA